MIPKSLLVVITIIFIGFLGMMGYRLNYPDQTEAEPIFHGFTNPQPSEPVMESNSFTPVMWQGLNISLDNPLWKDYDEDYLESFKEEILRSKSLWSTHNYFNSLYDKHVPYLGANGVVTGLNLVNQVSMLPIPEIHHLGEHIANVCLAKKVPIQFVLEVLSNNTLYRAMFHGASWEIIRDFGWSNPEKLNAFVEEHICNFKQNENLVDLWVDCIHGFGHGLIQIISDYTDAIAYCRTSSDKEWQYICATGIYMSYLNDNRFSLYGTIFPCDSADFPAACFRFKYDIFGPQANQELSFPCEYFHPYIRRGCIFGQGFVNSITADNLTAQVCNRYKAERFDPDDYVTCVYGFFSARAAGNLERNQIDYATEHCDYFDVPKARDICMKLRYTASGYHPYKFNDTWLWPYDLLEAPNV